jgi:condensin complex subunit 3
MPAPTRKGQKENPHELTVEVIQQSLSLIPPIFSQAQQSLASHKKNIVAIRKIQVQCSKLIEEHPNGRSLKLIGEKAFNAMFTDMVGRVLTVKKGVTVADRIVQFVGKYVAYTTEQGETRNGYHSNQ